MVVVDTLCCRNAVSLVVSHLRTLWELEIVNTSVVEMLNVLLKNLCDCLAGSGSAFEH